MPKRLRQKTDDELKNIAKDLVEGKIFTDRHIQDPKDVMLVFEVLAFLTDEQNKDFQEAIKSGEIALIYEYMDKAAPRSVNGMPIFFSCRTLTKDETEKVFEIAEDIKKAVDKVKVRKTKKKKKK